MPLTLANIGETVHITKINGRDRIVKHLMGLGFVPHTCVSVLSYQNGSLIVQLRDTRVAIDENLANRIQVSGDNR